jgi:hypothetical protein
MILDEYIILEELNFHEFRYFFQTFKVTKSIFNSFKKKKKNPVVIPMLLFIINNNKKKVNLIASPQTRSLHARFIMTLI